MTLALLAAPFAISWLTEGRHNALMPRPCRPSDLGRTRVEAFRSLTVPFLGCTTEVRETVLGSMTDTICNSANLVHALALHAWRV